MNNDCKITSNLVEFFLYAFVIAIITLALMAVSAKAVQEQEHLEKIKVSNACIEEGGIGRIFPAQTFPNLLIQCKDGTIKDAKNYY